MNEQANDESLLIDYLRNELEDQQRRELQQRLGEDAQLRVSLDDLSRTLGSLRSLQDTDPPKDLTQRTLERIRQHKQTQALIMRHESARPALRPTFSLREAAVIAASLLMIFTIIFSSASQARQHAQNGQCASNVGQMGTHLQSFAQDNGGRLPSAAGAARWMGEKANSNSAALFVLVVSQRAPQQIMRCPADGQAAKDNFQLTPEMADFPSARYISYSYQHAVGPKGLNCQESCLVKVAPQMAILADKTPYFTGGDCRIDPKITASSNHSGTGQNVLYLRWNTNFAPQPYAGVNGDNIYMAEGVTEYKGDERPSSPTDSFLLPAYAGR